MLSLQLCKPLNMLRTIVFLLLSLLLIPVSVMYFDQPLSSKQWNVLEGLLTIYLVTCFICFTAGELTGNVSQVDKLWSIMPVVYAWYMAAQGALDHRLVLMAILVTLWGARLTFNFWRRGGYSWIPWKGEEDYRWSILRKQPLLRKRWSWSLFNLGFITLYQQGLILLFTLPMLIAFEGIGKPVGLFDGMAAVLLIGFLIVETVADQQQYDFQKEKYRRLKNNEPLGHYSHGFVRSGLWSIVRHPNYASEQLIWVSFYIFSIAAAGRWLNWSLAGCILLMLLFTGSADFSEKISSEKYPDYQDYQQKVPRFWPFIK
jgi:steroid 5-alpha reductase family enzyme